MFCDITMLIMGLRHWNRANRGAFKVTPNRGSPCGGETSAVFCDKLRAAGYLTDSLRIRGSAARWICAALTELDSKWCSGLTQRTLSALQEFWDKPLLFIIYFDDWKCCLCCLCNIKVIIPYPVSYTAATRALSPPPGGPTIFFDTAIPTIS